MLQIINILLIIFAGIFSLFFLWAAFVSQRENENTAAIRFFTIFIVIILAALSVLFIDNNVVNIYFLITLFVVILIGIVVFLPINNNSSYTFEIPNTRIDERNTMFSRRELQAGSPDYINYYKKHPENSKTDDNFRKLPGLLAKGSRQYNPFHFASSNASFNTIEALSNEVNGEVNGEQVSINSQNISSYIKAWSKKLGAADSGICKLMDYHIYSVGGRHERRGVKYDRKHNFAIAFTVEMDKQMVDTAPKSAVVMESGQQYMNVGSIAVQVARFIRSLGYEARAHIDGNYEDVCPLVARDAGLGEIGRMGILITHTTGPRARIGVVTTNMMLEIDHVKPNYSVIDFCTICKKCAESCPSQAISFSDREQINGVNRWQINQEACFTLWCSMGTDCSRCMSVCPYSHENNTLHNLVRYGINNNFIFRRIALKMDDFFYGRKPASKEIPKALRI